MHHRDTEHRQHERRGAPLEGNRESHPEQHGRGDPRQASGQGERGDTAGPAVFVSGGRAAVGEESGLRGGEEGVHREERGNRQECWVRIHEKSGP